MRPTVHKPHMMQFVFLVCTTRVTCVGVFDDAYPVFVCVLQENAKSFGVFEL